MVTETSKEIYRKIQEDLGAQELQVFNAFKINGHMTNRMASSFTGLPINCITARVHKLREKGLLESKRTGECLMTKHNATYWGVGSYTW